MINPTALIPPAAGPSNPLAGLPGSDAPSFERLLAERVETDDRIETVREESRKLVAEAFIRPLLAKIRDNNDAAAPFGPTDAEKRFGPMLDQTVADAMTRPDRFPMVKAVERSILERMGAVESGGVR